MKVISIFSSGSWLGGRAWPTAMGAGTSKLLAADSQPPLPSLPPPPPPGVAAALEELGPVLVNIGKAILASPGFVLVLTLAVAGLAAWFERSLTSSAYVLAIFAVAMAFEATQSDSPLTPAALGFAAIVLLAWPLYRDRHVSRRVVGFVVAFVSLQCVMEGAQVLAAKTAWLLESAGEWGAVPTACRASSTSTSSLPAY